MLQAPEGYPIPRKSASWGALAIVRAWRDIVLQLGWAQGDHDAALLLL